MPSLIMKNIYKILITLASGLFVFTALSFTPQIVYASDDICSDYTEGWIKCPTESISFTKYTGELVKIGPEGYDPALTRVSSVRDFIQKVVNFALSFLGLAAILLIIYAGVRYMTAAGNTESTDKAKKTIGYTAAGLLLIMASYAIVNTLLTGPFDGDTGAEGSLGGMQASSFNTSTQDIVKSAQDLITNYKNLTDAASTLATLKSNAFKSSLGGIGVLTTKSNIVQYLNDVKVKLQALRYKAPQFSAVLSQINNIGRYIDQKIDQIQTLTGVMYVEGSDLSTVCPETEMFWDDLDWEIPADLSGCVKVAYADMKSYADQKLGNGDGKTTLFELWREIKEDLTESTYLNWSKVKELLEAISTGFNTDPSDDLSPPKYSYMYSLQSTLALMKAEFAGPEGIKFDDNIKCTLDVSEKRSLSILEKQYCTLKKVFSDVSSVEIAKVDQIKAIKDSIGGIFNQLNTSIWASTFDTNPGEANSYVVNIIQTEDGLVTAIQDIQFVDVKLVASTVEGSAPLVVRFDVLNSKDPSGATIDPKKIKWNLCGGVTDTKRCEAGPDGEFTNYATYGTAGAYEASVSIEASDTKKYATGKSNISIVVHEPETIVNLKYTIGSKTEYLIQYKEGKIYQEKDFIVVTPTEANPGGIKFDASESNGDTAQGQQIKNYKWTYGDGTPIVDGQTKSGDTHQYTKEGKYQAMLELEETNGQTGRKIFTVIVGSPVARISVTPSKQEYNLGETITLDGSGSTSDVGAINSYKWTITKPDKTTKTETVKTFTYKLDQPTSADNLYKISLEVTDKLSSAPAVAIPLELTVNSVPPVPVFTYSVPKKSIPSEYRFDAAKTYDPDGELDKISKICYQWTTNPPPTPGKVDFITDPVPPPVDKPIILFGEKGDYEVKLTVWNENECSTEPPDGAKTAESTKKITVDNVLDVEWKSFESTSVLEGGKATITPKFKSDHAVSYKIDFGDGEKAEGANEKGKEMSVSHVYTKSGPFKIKLTVYDEEDNYSETSKKVYVGDSGKPLAKIGVYLNTEELIDFEEPIEITRADMLTFDASESKNVDGTGKDLKYSWDFGDGEKSTKKTIVHKYKEVTPEGKPVYTVRLKVYDKDDPVSIAAEANFKVKVVSANPVFSSLQVMPEVDENLITPSRFAAKIFGAKDEDGIITQYKWWYYDVEDPDEILGIQITQSPAAFISIGTKGKEGDEKTYKFGAEITDNENNSVSSEGSDNSEAQIDSDKIPFVKVKNGPNIIPVAGFAVDQTKVFAGDPVNFSSTSKDPDGKIIQYIWDFEGDGFFNDEPTTESTVTHMYEEKNLNGYKVRLKVVDSSYAEAVSQPVTIYIDSNAKPPKAAFKSEIVSGKTVEFINNSEADEKAGASIKEYVWDFDTASQFTSSDADGDGKKDNDDESNQENPDFTYDEFGIYQVKLTVKDDKGNISSVTNMINLINTESPVVNTQNNGGTGTAGGGSLSGPVGSEGGSVQSILKAILSTTPSQDINGLVTLPGTAGNVTFDFSRSTGPIVYYIIDKNIYFDSDSDGVANNDANFKTSLPGQWTTNFDKSWGKTAVKLTVTDSLGNAASTVQEITFK